MTEDAEPGAARKPGPTAPSLGRRLGRLAMAVHRGLYKASGGKVGGRMFGTPVLLLTTIGRRSGRQRTTPLMYLVHGESVVIVASNGGNDRMPTWYLNLRTTPRVEIQRGRQSEIRVARKATVEERAELWPKLTAMYSGYESYAAKTSRRIPVVILDRDE